MGYPIVGEIYVALRSGSFLLNKPLREDRRTQTSVSQGDCRDNACFRKMHSTRGRPSTLNVLRARMDIRAGGGALSGKSPTHVCHPVLENHSVFYLHCMVCPARVPSWQCFSSESYMHLVRKGPYRDCLLLNSTQFIIFFKYRCLEFTSSSNVPAFLVNSHRGIIFISFEMYRQPSA